ncbi:ATP/GTP-binding protein [Streptomyces sp. NPDC005574]|uniref:GTP-binding protein n=1 Tax=Streptomyces sp. NPDC005574 TaxID=3156891 RepID=UPI0033A004A5
MVAKGSAKGPGTRQPASGRSGRIVPLAVKIVVSGGLGVGKSTFIRAISEIDRPLETEAPITQVSVGVDSLAGVESKTTTTVALDFGRVTLDPTIALYLFGTPGQNRFSFLWDDLVEGALGTVVLADTRRIEECFPAVDYFERQRAPFVLAVNRFDGAERFELNEVAAALGLGAEVPVLECDARDRASVRDVLAVLMDRVAGAHGPARQPSAVLARERPAPPRTSTGSSVPAGRRGAVR